MGEGKKYIWVLFGDIKMPSGKPNSEVRNRIISGYNAHKEKLASIGYTLTYGNEPSCSKNEFLRIVSDQTTYAFIWLSHSNRLGVLTGGLGNKISPSDIENVSKNLKFAALWGCDIQQSASVWRRALKLNRSKFPDDAIKRLASHYTSVYDHDYKLGNNLAVVPPQIKFITNKNPLASNITNKSYYNFTDWIRLLPQKEHSLFDFFGQ